MQTSVIFFLQIYIIHDFTSDFKSRDLFSHNVPDFIKDIILEIVNYFFLFYKNSENALRYAKKCAIIADGN